MTGEPTVTNRMKALFQRFMPEMRYALQAQQTYSGAQLLSATALETHGQPF